MAGAQVGNTHLSCAIPVFLPDVLLPLSTLEVLPPALPPTRPPTPHHPPQLCHALSPLPSQSHSSLIPCPPPQTHNPQHTRLTSTAPCQPAHHPAAAPRCQSPTQSPGGQAGAPLLLLQGWQGRAGRAGAGWCPAGAPAPRAAPATAPSPGCVASDRVTHPAATRLGRQLCALVHMHTYHGTTVCVPMHECVCIRGAMHGNHALLPFAPFGTDSPQTQPPTQHPLRTTASPPVPAPAWPQRSPRAPSPPPPRAHPRY